MEEWGQRKQKEETERAQLFASTKGTDAHTNVRDTLAQTGALKTNSKTQSESLRKRQYVTSLDFLSSP